jgi:3-hydroxyisobutyrate dehydrogenase-like beta-hydroxyacid dehydrogenase
MASTIGFVGLGLLGSGFTRRLVESGYDVVGYDIDPARLKEAAKWGVRAASSATEIARVADVILVCVINTAAVEDVALGARGVAAHSKLDGKIVVDHSTTEIAATHRIAAALKRRGAAFVDAPVSGGPAAAEAGRLAIMAGGEADTIARIAPLMQRLGQLTHMGPVGTGQATKLVNQTIVLTNYCVLAEALRLGEAYGVDTTKIPQALATGHAGSGFLSAVFPRMVQKDFTPHGYARQVLKDLEMLQAAAAKEHLAMPMATQALNLYRLLVAQGAGEVDASAVVTLYPQAKVHVD